MTDLADFLLARIAEDEQVAHAADEQGWEWRTREGVLLADGLTAKARILAGCAARRRIVEKWLRWQGAHLEQWDTAFAAGLEDAVHLLAAPYADHPDYDARWRP